MKRLSLPLIALVAFIGASAQTPALHNVYILPMAEGLDQYLAEQLTRDHVMQVVADPKAADVVLTDRIGESFEQKMAQLRPELRPEPHPEKDTSRDSNADGGLHRVFQTSGTRGTIFLVDSKSRQVLWSDYEKPSGSASTGSLNRKAARIAKKLALRGK